MDRTARSPAKARHYTRRRGACKLYACSRFRASGLVLDHIGDAGGGAYKKVIRIAPPLNVSAAEIDEALAILERAMAAVA